MPTSTYLHKLLPGKPGGALLFVLHGTGGDENQFPALGRDLIPDATIVSPRGDVSEHGSARFFRRTAEGVYDMADLARATAKMTDFVAAHIESAKPSAVHGLGYSNGANILAASLFARPDLFDATALMHPLIPFEPEIVGSLSGRRILMTAGRRDPICPPNLTSRLESWLRGGGADVIVEWHEGGHEVRPNEIEAARRFFQRPEVENGRPA
ncbi:MAG: alpha/beta hydrolase [Mesorhizobium sp.]|nr:alpha/beta hydrolase [Mesorhizobium sp.]